MVLPELMTYWCIEVVDIASVLSFMSRNFSAISRECIKSTTIKAYIGNVEDAEKKPYNFT